MTYFQLLNPIITRQMLVWRYSNITIGVVFGSGTHVSYLMDYAYGVGGGFSKFDYTTLHDYPL